jgi:peptidoglycan hydrolase-like protein with peptidoglycan-binding domain
MTRRASSLVLTLVLVAFASWADDLTQSIQKDLVALGYDPGSIQGEATLQTSAAISKFQADNGLEVTGAVTPQLAGVLSAKVDQLRHGAGSSPAAAPAASTAAAPKPKTDNSRCPSTVANAANETGKKARAVERLAWSLHRLGGKGQAAQAASEVANATSAAADAAAAAHDLTKGSSSGC